MSNVYKTNVVNQLIEASKQQTSAKIAYKPKCK